MGKQRPPRPSAGSYYRPDRAQFDAFRPRQDRIGETQRRSNPRQTSPRRHPPNLPPVRSAVSKTKHERSTNPSTRIHSLRRLLTSQQDLPGTVRQEKERELAALLFDQRKALLTQNARKNLQRYHFVRFMERKKAERALKQLLRQRDSEQSHEQAYNTELKKLIHIAEVDINYTKYAPLGEKYISLFVQEGKKERQDRPKINKTEMATYDADQRNEILQLADQLSNVVRSASGAKPPMWYEVEKLMDEGEAKLEALRDGKLTTDKQLQKELAAIGGKQEAELRRAHGNQLQEMKPSWLDDDGIIDPADLDSDQDDDMSDGGFFER
ncbi:hypothetical protein Z517_08016 [Fonsecaea pedrosoi CBS 271.37]|uniref:rRNA-processing protein EFG1 n=1 Tax=Fonsecaea pedrosoi CBS 271.37 TaxID=1442368 RepID=A0A0D2GBZ5_9EURO|nr:uncharacterized protein Z517_08016 [Fonsecaea pedrosoi CBS 271.37]KIW78183.1 hypothetical protein Z517_08016 [Fonsecaea pedrosoi CBS 271.37]